MALIYVLVLFVLADGLLERKIQASRKYEEMCKNVTKEPNFKDDFVIGRVWRIYYAWNMMMGNQCMDISFKKATTWTIDRFHNDIKKYMNTEVAWSKATIVMTMNTTREMILIPDEDYPNIGGRFLGVPNVLKGGYLGAKLGRVSLYKMAMNLFNDDRFLVIGDCENGVVSFLVRRDQKHTWGEITSVVSNLDQKFVDQGYPACKFNMRKKSRRRQNTND